MSRKESIARIRLKHILVATDLSPVSLQSLPYVAEIARHYRSTVYIAHVIPLGTYVVARPQSFDTIEKECREHASQRLTEFSAQIATQRIAVQTLLAEGDVGVIIPEWIKKHDIDLVAAGTTGRGGIRKLALGSTAEEIIRAADCAVLTVGPEATETPVALRNLLYATDFSPDSVRAGAYALSIAEHHRARLIVLHVTQDEGTEQSRRQLAKKLKKFVANGTKLLAEPEIVIASGKPTQKILEVAREHFVDLIAIGTRGTGLARAASHFGSTAHDIVVHASCPVLTVRASQPAL
jgi:nucleotide-binding universal stress UspA family protein